MYLSKTENTYITIDAMLTSVRRLHQGDIYKEQKLSVSLPTTNRLGAHSVEPYLTTKAKHFLFISLFSLDRWFTRNKIPGRYTTEVETILLRLLWHFIEQAQTADDNSRIYVTSPEGRLISQVVGQIYRFVLGDCLL